MAQASTESALLEQIANKDSTGDGLPDWQKALYGIPLNATTTDYFHLGMTDGEAVAKGLIVPVASTPGAPAPTPSMGTTAASFGLTAPASGSLTDTFAKNFFALYVNASQQAGGALSSDEIDTLAQQALTELSASVTPAPDFKTASDIKVSGSGPDAMRAYAASVEAAINTYDPHTSGNDLEDLQDYLNTGSQADLDNLTKLAAFYQQAATGLAALTVPSEMASAHLALVNALARIGWEDSDFSHADSDPLSSMLALTQHIQTTFALRAAFASIVAAYAKEGVMLPAGSPGSSFMNLAGMLSTSPSTP